MVQQLTEEEKSRGGNGYLPDFGVCVSCFVRNKNSYYDDFV